MATERQIFGEIAIKEMIIETKTRITENPASTENETTVEKEDTGRLIVGPRKVKRKTMKSKTSLWEPHYVDKYKKTTRNNILKNG